LSKFTQFFLSGNAPDSFRFYDALYLALDGTYTAIAGKTGQEKWKKFKGNVIKIGGGSDAGGGGDKKGGGGDKKPDDKPTTQEVNFACCLDGNNVNPVQGTECPADAKETTTRRTQTQTTEETDDNGNTFVTHDTTNVFGPYCAASIAPAGRRLQTKTTVCTEPAAAAKTEETTTEAAKRRFQGLVKNCPADETKHVQCFINKDEKVACAKITIPIAPGDAEKAAKDAEAAKGDAEAAKAAAAKDAEAAKGDAEAATGDAEAAKAAAAKDAEAATEAAATRRTQDAGTETTTTETETTTTETTDTATYTDSDDGVDLATTYPDTGLEQPTDDTFAGDSSQEAAGYLFKFGLFALLVAFLLN
jgi:hypothetical protein